MAPPMIEDQYELSQQKQKWMRRAEFAFVQFLRLIFAFLKLILNMVIMVIKGVLKVFGVPIRD